MQDKYRHKINALVRPNILPLKEACEFKCFQFHNKIMSSFTANNVFKKFQTLTFLKEKNIFEY